MGDAWLTPPGSRSGGEFPGPQQFRCGHRRRGSVDADDALTMWLRAVVSGMVTEWLNARECNVADDRRRGPVPRCLRLAGGKRLRSSCTSTRRLPAGKRPWQQVAHGVRCRSSTKAAFRRA